MTLSLSELSLQFIGLSLRINSSYLFPLVNVEFPAAEFVILRYWKGYDSFFGEYHTNDGI